MRAVEEADILFIGPGSFFGSTLAAVTTGDLGGAVARCRGRVVFVENVAQEAAAAPHGADAERVLRDHLVIKSGGEIVVFDVLRHVEADGAVGVTRREDGSLLLCTPLARPGARVHDEAMLAAAIATHVLQEDDSAPASRAHARRPQGSHDAARSELERRVHAARARLATPIARGA